MNFENFVGYLKKEKGYSENTVIAYLNDLNQFEKIIPCFSPEDAFKLKKEVGGIVAGERNGKKIEGFDLGNSPTIMKDYETDEKLLILTTTNGTRALEKIQCRALIGSMINAKAVAKKSCELAETHIELVMGGVNGDFAIEDFLAAGEIIHEIKSILKKCEVSEYAESAVLASRDYESLKEAFKNSKSANILYNLGYENDVELCCQKNISKNVAIYENHEIKLIKD
jgi:2-phosphosulfolactate phosphatase